MHISKNRKNINKKIDIEKSYDLSEAIKILKENSFTKFNETVDVAINLTIDASKTEQNIKGVTNLPNGTGKEVVVAAIVSDDKIAEAKESGADIVGNQDLLDHISKGKINFDTLIATPDMMPTLGKVAKILGPKGLMPNPKLGTVTKDISSAIKNSKSGQVKYKNDKSGIIHAGIGKLNFSEEEILQNIKAFFSSINKNKPEAVKGSFIKKVTIASTMGVGLEINQGSLRWFHPADDR